MKVGSTNRNPKVIAQYYNMWKELQVIDNYSWVIPCQINTKKSLPSPI